MMNADDAEYLYDGECRQEIPGTGTPKPDPEIVVLPTATTSGGEVIVDVPTPEEIGSAWHKFWTSFKSILFFWR